MDAAAETRERGDDVVVGDVATFDEEDGRTKFCPARAGAGGGFGHGVEDGLIVLVGGHADRHPVELARGVLLLLIQLVHDPVQRIGDVVQEKVAAWLRKIGGDERGDGLGESGQRGFRREEVRGERKVEAREVAQLGVEVLDFTGGIQRASHRARQHGGVDAAAADARTVGGGGVAGDFRIHDAERGAAPVENAAAFGGQADGEIFLHDAVQQDDRAAVVENARAVLRAAMRDGHVLQGQHHAGPDGEHAVQQRAVQHGEPRPLTHEADALRDNGVQIKVAGGQRQRAARAGACGVRGQNILQREP